VSERSNRERLLDSALQLFAERGYDAAGVQEVCTVAGVTKPTLYHYFGSKRGLLDALLRERSAPLLEGLEIAARDAGDLPRTLQRVMAASFGFARREPVLWRLLLALWFASPESEARQCADSVREEQRRILEGMFARAVPAHGNMRGREGTYAAVLLGTIHTWVSMALAGELTLDEATAHRAVHQFSHGIYS
jgi:AcrR family transcriptional regulator